MGANPGGYHHISIDVEEFFHSTLLVEKVRQDRWSSFPRRASLIVPWILEQLDAAGSKATFFVLGWTAEQDPDLVREIAEAGHEIAAHSWRHRRVDGISPEEFRESIRRTKYLLEDLSGRPVLGYRAPSFSISPGCEWAFDILLEEGYRYDSSVFPIDFGPGYGNRGASRDPFWIKRPAGTLYEVPLLTLRFLGRCFPAAGGGYLRLMPFSLVEGALRQVEARGMPGTLYIHPWDLDPGLQPLEELSPLLKTRLHAGVGRARRRLTRLIERYPSRIIADTLDRTLQSGDPPKP